MSLGCEPAWSRVSGYFSQGKISEVSLLKDAVTGRLIGCGGVGSISSRFVSSSSLLCTTVQPF